MNDLFTKHRESYAQIHGVGFRIRCHLAPHGRKAGDSYQATDGILAYAVAREATNGEVWQLTGESAHDVPIPLAIIGQSARGTLYACSALTPMNKSMQWIDWTHRRPRNGGRQVLVRGKLPKVNDRGGADQPRRTPIPIEMASVYEARCIGDPTETLRLLQTHITHIGPRRGIGCGEVAAWSVETDESLTILDVLIQEGDYGPTLSRPVPADLAATLFGAGVKPLDIPTFGGWRNPYWHDAGWASRWSHGTPVEVVV